MEIKLQFANTLLASEMECSPDAILVVGVNNEILSFNARFTRLLAIKPASYESGNGKAVLSDISASFKDKNGFLATMSYIEAHPELTVHDEVETTSGTIIERQSVGMHTATGAYLGRVWFLRDITARKSAEAEVQQTARHDGLTGLANRIVFVETLEHAINLAKRGAAGFAVIYLDLDHFKDVNDTLGHPVGDELLRAVAGRLQANVRVVDTVARFGGDEFAIVAPGIAALDDAVALAEKLIQGLAGPFRIHGSDIHVAASIGVDLYGPGAADAEALLSHADVALYRAKAEGRGTYRFFTVAMDAEVRTRVTLGAELRKALQLEQFFLLYQPQVSIDTGQMTGVEALVRWMHPVRGVLGPEAFISMAERTGLMVKLGHWVLWEACRQARLWMDLGKPPIRTAVNLSGLQFRAPTKLESDIRAALLGTGLAPSLLELELTETVLMGASQEHNDVLVRLHKSGITIAIDDFGTGYSSLEYLSRFPADRIKIAQEFVATLDATSRNAAIVRATISLARELGIATIAEGVETNEKIRLLKQWGCEEIQGFYFSRPLPPEGISALLLGGGMVKPASECETIPATSPSASVG